MPTMDLYLNKHLELQFEVSDKPIKIGRSSACDLCVNDPLVSREHAEIRPTPEGYLLVNLSQFGTRLNQDLVKESRLLAFGDRLYLGARHAIIFEKDGKVAYCETMLPGQLPKV